MKQIVLSLTVTLAAAAPFALHGEDLPENLDRLSLGARFGMNFKADFRNNTAFRAAGGSAASPGAATGGVDHNYDDGYVRLDSSGNAGGLTWNWGYQTASQVAGNTMQFHATQAGTPSSPGLSDATDDPQFGTELTYQRILGRLPVTSGLWGFETGLGYTALSLQGDSSASRVDTTTTDTYQLNGVLPPSAGYNGTYTGPGALLGDTPTRASASSTTTLNTHEKLSGNLYSIRLGPFAEWELAHKLSLAASVGLTLAPASVEYDFSEVTTTSAGVTTVAGGHTDKNTFLYGPYVGVTLRYDFNPGCGAFVGAQFQSLNDLEESVGGHTGRLDQSATVYGILGFSLKF